MLVYHFKLKINHFKIKRLQANRISKKKKKINKQTMKKKKKKNLKT